MPSPLFNEFEFVGYHYYLTHNIEEYEKRPIQIMPIHNGKETKIIKLINDTESIRENCTIYCHSNYSSSLKTVVQSRFDLEFSAASKVKAKGVVFHLPKIPIPQLMDSVKLLIESRNKYLTNGKIFILLEVIACIPSKNLSYETPEMINKLYEALEQNFGLELDSIGFVPDTAHLHCSEVSITTKEQAEKWFNQIKYKHFIKLIHLNGNSTTTHKDKHALPFDGDDYIWNKISYDDSGVKVFIDFAKDNNIDVIIEEKDSSE